MAVSSGVAAMPLHYLHSCSQGNIETGTRGDRDRDTETRTHRDRDTQRQRDTETGTHRNRDTQRQGHTKSGTRIDLSLIHI